MIRMLSFVENSFIASTFSSKLHLRLWEFPFAKSFEESFLPDRYCWSYQKRRSSLRYFCRKYCCYQYGNLIIYSLNTYRRNKCYDTMSSYWAMDENVIFSDNGLNTPIHQKIKAWSLLKWHNVILYPSKHGDRHQIILIPCIVTEILTKEGFPVMAALICILGRWPKDDRVASFSFLKSTPRRYRKSKKKTLYGRYCTLIGPCHRTISCLFVY